MVSLFYTLIYKVKNLLILVSAAGFILTISAVFFRLKSLHISISAVILTIGAVFSKLKTLLISVSVAGFILPISTVFCKLNPKKFRISIIEVFQLLTVFIYPLISVLTIDNLVITDYYLSMISLSTIGSEIDVKASIEVLNKKIAALVVKTLDVNNKPGLTSAYEEVLNSLIMQRENLHKLLLSNQNNIKPLGDTQDTINQSLVSIENSIMDKPIVENKIIAEDKPSLKDNKPSIKDNKSSAIVNPITRLRSLLPGNPVKREITLFFLVLLQVEFKTQVNPNWHYQPGLSTDNSDFEKKTSSKPTYNAKQLLSALLLMPSLLTPYNQVLETLWQSHLSYHMDRYEKIFAVISDSAMPLHYWLNSLKSLLNNDQKPSFYKVFKDIPPYLGKYYKDKTAKPELTAEKQYELILNKNKELSKKLFKDIFESLDNAAFTALFDGVVKIPRNTPVFVENIFRTYDLNSLEYTIRFLEKLNESKKTQLDLKKAKKAAEKADNSAHADQLTTSQVSSPETPEDVLTLTSPHKDE